MDMYRLLCFTLLERAPRFNRIKITKLSVSSVGRKLKQCTPASSLSLYVAAATLLSDKRFLGFQLVNKETAHLDSTSFVLRQTCASYMHWIAVRESAVVQDEYLGELHGRFRPIDTLSKRPITNLILHDLGDVTC